MSQNNKNNDSDILNLESLIKEYDTLLIQFSQVQTDYNNFLKTNHDFKTGLTSIKGNTFWGTSGISSSYVANVEECVASCSATTGCSGATYNPSSTTQNNCFLRGGDGDIINGTSEQYAIVPKNKEYLYTLQNLNAQLLQINNEIVIIIQSNNDILKTQNTERQKQIELLKQNFEKLRENKNFIEGQLYEIQSLQEEQNQSELYVNKNYYNYILLVFIVFIFVFITSKIFINSNNENVNANWNVFVIIIFVFLIVFLLFLFIRFIQRKPIGIF